MVVALPGEEGAVEVAQVVIDGSAAAVATGEVDGVASEEGNVGLEPGILVAADNNAGGVAPQQEEVLNKENHV